MFENLPAELRADGTRSSRYQHRAPTNCAFDRLQVDLYGIPPQQILHVDFPEITEADSLGDDIPQSRHGSELYPRSFAPFHEALHLPRGCRGHRDQHFVDSVSVDQFGHLIHGSQNADTLDTQSLL